MISFDLQEFEKVCAKRPEGYREHVLSMAKISSGRVWLKPEDHTYLSNYYRNSEPPEPRLIDSVENVARAMGRWAAAGFPLASEASIKVRKNTCEACPYWDSEARLGLGKCTHEKCGCTKLKWWLETETCPDNRWPHITE